MAVAAEYAGGTPTPRPVGTHQVTERTAPGKFLRTVWRTHFYAAIIAAPILALMAITGLVIMYTEPITGLLHPGTPGWPPRGNPSWDWDSSRSKLTRPLHRGRHCSGS